MRMTILAALLAISVATTAAAQDLSAFTFHDLNGARHQMPVEWQGKGGVLILGFAHDARDSMDQWVTALHLRPEDAWLEAPVVGDVSGMIQPIIRAAMRAHYDAAHRAHVTPVFEGADTVRTAAAPGSANVVVLIIDAHGGVMARFDGPATENNLRSANTILAELSRIQTQH